MIRKKKVLQIAFNDLGHGGIQAVIMTIARGIAADVEQDIVVFSSKEAFYDEEYLNYGRIFRCSHYEGNNLIRKKLDYYFRYNRIKNDIKRIIRKYGPYDIVHSHSFFEAAPCMQAAYECGVPIRIAHSHNTAASSVGRSSLKQVIRNKYNECYKKIILKYATECVGCSRAAVEYLFGKGNGRVIYNSIDVERFIRVNRSEQNSLSILHVGNFLYQKNQLFLVDVFHNILAEEPTATLTMIGRFSDYLQGVKERIIQYGDEKNIFILPHDSDVADALGKSNVFVFPSNFEGFGLAIVEAQAAGVQCFASTKVPNDVDCGLVEFIELEKGATYWAERIVEEYRAQNGIKEVKDLERFTEHTFMSQIRALYQL